jgi:hypothetical protein
MLGIWLLSKRLFGRSDIALLSLMSLNLSGIINFDVIPYNDNYLLIMFWPYLFLFFIKAVYENTYHWLSLAIVAGLAAMSKYSTCAFLPFMLLYILLVPAARKALRSPVFYLAILLFLLLLAPNAVWLYRHDYAAFNWVHSQITRGFNLKAAIAFVAVFYPAFLLALVLLPLGGKLGVPSAPEKRAVIFVFAPPILLILVYFLFHRGGRITEWLQPFAILTPVVLFSLLNLDRVRSLRKVSSSLLAIAVVVCLGYALVHQLNIRGAGSKFNYIQDVSAEINVIWRDRYDRPLKYVGGSRFSRWLTFYAPDRPAITTPWSNDKKPTIYNARIVASDIMEDGALFVSNPGDTCDQANFAESVSDFPGIDIPEKQEYWFRDEKGRLVGLCLGFSPPHRLSRLDI